MRQPVTRPVAVKLDVALHERMKMLAETRQRSTHWLMREAVQQYVQREELRADFRNSALAAWVAYETTGRHATHDEADRWLSQLEDGQDTPPPAC
jgi:predicted transcriptional regulator